MGEILSQPPFPLPRCSRKLSERLASVIAYADADDVRITIEIRCKSALTEDVKIIGRDSMALDIKRDKTQEK